MNLTQLITATRTRLGVPTTDSFFTDTNLTDLINAGLEYAASQWDWYWLESSESLSTANGVETVSPAATSQRTVNLFDSVGVPLERKSLTDLYRMGPSTGANIRFFAYRGSTIILRPVPNGVISLTHIYRGTEPRLVSNSDTPAMPSQFHDVIADYATYFAHLRQGQQQEAEKWKASGDAWIDVMKAHADRFSESDGGGAEEAQGNQS